MSRAQQLKSGDVSLGLAHEWVCAFGRQGGTAAMLQQTLEDADRMRCFVEAISVDSQCVAEAAAMAALTAAVEKGVTEKDGYYEFEDPGLSLIMQRKLPVVREKKLIYVQDWYNGYDWAKREDTPQTRHLRIPVEGSFGENFPTQEKLLLPEEEVPSTRVVTMFLVINALATGKRLLPDRWVRCIDKDSGGRRVDVGHFDANGLNVDNDWDDDCHARIGLAAARKS